MIKDKKIRIISAVVSLISVLAVIPIMFEFFQAYNDYDGITYSYGIYGYSVYLLDDINIVIGVFGLIALLWDLVYGAYALIDGRYRNLTWRIARYGYFYGIFIGIINFAFIVSFMFFYMPYACSIIYLILIATTIVLKFILIFTKDEETKQKSLNEYGN